MGSAEVFCLMLTGGSSLRHDLADFLAPAVLGNTVGGVVFVALLNYAQFHGSHVLERGERLSWREWLLERHKTA